MTNPRLFPLKCRFCGETWMGTAAGIGRTCDQNQRLGSLDVVQCDPEELVQDIDFDVEVF